MATNDVRRNYNMTDAELCMFTSNLCNFLTRDLLDFATFGVTAPKIAALKALGDAFEVFPTDGSLIGDVMITTEDKNALRVQVLATIREMAARVEAKWGISSGKYRRLDLRNPSQMSDDSLLIAANTVHTKMTDYLADLADFGLTEAMLDDFDTLIEDFENAKNAQADTVAMRDEKTIERITKGNQIYALVSTYCGFGKILYEKTNPAKYNDYIIYDTVSPGSLTPPTGLSFYFPSTTFSWNEVANASSYRLMASVNNIDWIEVYAGEFTECVYVPIQTGNMFYKVQGRNDNGFGPFSETLTQGYYPGTVLPAPENLVIQLAAGSPNTIQLNFSPVPSAVRYGVNRSIVAIGAGPGPFNFVTNVLTNEYIETVIPGNRFYYRLTAENSNQWSGVSETVFIDVV